MIITKGIKLIDSSRKASRNNPDKADIFTSLVEETYQIFPFSSFKSEQGRLIQKTLLNDRLIVHASTGFGKTAVMLSVLLPFVRRFNRRLIIVTRTKMQIFNVYMKELRNITSNMKNKGLSDSYKKGLAVLPLVGKSSMCINDSVTRGQTTHACNVPNATCKQYKKVKSMNYSEYLDIMNHLDWLEDFRSIKSYRNVLKEHGCPYYLSWRMLGKADIILVTHAYLKNPDLLSLLLKALDKSNEHDPKQSILLIDEAHDFGPVILAELTKSDLDFIASQFPYDIITDLRDQVAVKKGMIDISDVSNLDLEVLKLALGTFQQNARKSKDKTIRDKFLKNTKIISNFLDFVQAKGDYWVVVPPQELDEQLPGQLEMVRKMSLEEISALEKQRKVISLQPFPGEIFRSLEGFEKVILMSGTFKPVNLYVKYYGLKECKRIYSEWVAKGDAGKRFEAILVNRSYSSSFKDRTTQNYERYAGAIKKLHGVNPNHTVVFCPSYSFKDGLMRFLGTKYEEKSKLGGFEWLDELAYLNHELVIATAGGKLVEGIEILRGGRGRSLITLVIYAGLPYPPPDFLSREVLGKLYAKKWNKEIAKQFLSDLPLLRNIQQGFGRGIRNPDDFSAAIILDWRGQYLNVFDKYVKTANMERLIAKLKRFYETTTLLQENFRTTKDM